MSFDELLELSLLAQIVDQNERNQNKIGRRTLRDAANPFTLPEKLFIAYFRLSKELCSILINRLKQFIPERKRCTGIAIEIKILTALSFFGHGSYQKCISNHLHHAMDQSKVSKIISEVSQAMVDYMLSEWIIFPQTELLRSKIKEGYLIKYSFPGIIGAIDCTHIAIIAPKTDDPVRPGLCYYNRKGFYSLNVQVICDSNLKILNCNAKFPGSVHDSAIWTLSAVNRHLQNLYLLGELGSSWLIGDSGYGLQPWLLTPIVDADENSSEGRYTSAHIAARNTVERCFGVLKQRFRCLLKHRVLHYDPTKASKIVLSCAILHNMAIDHLSPLPEDNNDFVDPVPTVTPPSDEPDTNWLSEGRKVQSTLIRNHFNNVN